MKREASDFAGDAAGSAARATLERILGIHWGEPAHILVFLEGDLR
jgi:hypothetical protein